MQFLKVSLSLLLALALFSCAVTWYIHPALPLRLIEPTFSHDNEFASGHTYAVIVSLVVIVCAIIWPQKMPAYGNSLRRVILRIFLATTILSLVTWIGAHDLPRVAGMSFGDWMGVMLVSSMLIGIELAGALVYATYFWGSLTQGVEKMNRTMVP